MKLCIICETNRRGFLRQLGSGAVGIASGGWKNALKNLLSGSDNNSAEHLVKLYKGLTPSAAGIVRNFAFSLVNSWGDSEADKYIDLAVKDGHLIPPISINSPRIKQETEPEPVVPVEAVAGYFIDSAMNSDNQTAASILTGDNPTYVNKLFPGLIDKCVDMSVAKLGPEAFMMGIRYWFDDVGSIDFNMLIIAFKNAALQNYYQLTPAMLDSIGETGIGIQKLIDKGLASEELVADHLKHIRRFKNWSKEQQSKNRYDDSKRNDTTKTDDQNIEELLDIDVPDDYYYASSMHQPFESRLRLALNYMLID